MASRWNIICTYQRIILMSGNGPCSWGSMDQEARVWIVGGGGNLMPKRRDLFSCVPVFPVMRGDIIRMLGRVQSGARLRTFKRNIELLHECSLRAFQPAPSLYKGLPTTIQTR